VSAAIASTGREPEPLRTTGYWPRAARRFLRQPVPVLALAVLAGLFVAGALAPQLAPERWNSIDLSPRWHNHGPTLAAHHWLGTDNIGRDVVVRTLWGLHDTEQTALAGAALAALVGLALGGIAGMYGGRLDALLMRLADLVTAFPAVVLVIAAFFLLSPLNEWKATVLFALYMWTQLARALRARVVEVGASEYVEAARALGAQDGRIFFRHVLPNVAGTVVVAATSLVGQIILIETTAEFFGFGIPSLIHPTLGNLLSDATTSGIGTYNTLGLGWWVWGTPALALVLILICVNLVGDGLDNALAKPS
jgi:peptide/nickel transport system permease protein